MSQVKRVKQIEQIDLHTHSSCSDGRLRPAELIAYAKEKNLTAIALTDHDTISGLKEAADAAAENSIEFVNGIELGVLYNGEEYHILGLLLNPDAAVLKSKLPDIRELRRERNEKMLTLLNERGIDISAEDFPENTIITRAHFARALVAKQYCKSLSEAFDKYLSPGCDTYVRRELLSAESGIELIKQCSGIPLLAHPLRYGLDNAGVEFLIRRLADLGLMGIEALYSANTQADDALLLALAKKYRLKISGGSDFHSLDKNGIDLGCGYGNLFVHGKILDDLKKPGK